MASTVPAAKSHPLHNFSLSHLKWKNSHQRPRSSSAGGSAAARLSSSPSPHRSPSSFGHDSVPTLHSPLQGADSAAAAVSPLRHSPMRVGFGGEESVPPVHSRQSPMRRGVSDDSSDPQPNQSPSSHKSSKPLIEYRRQSRNSVSCSVKNNGVITSSPGRDAVEEKSEKKLKGVESDNKQSKSSKILIKIRQKSSKIAEEVQVEEEGKLEDNEEAQEEEGKQLLAAFDDDDEPLPKTWNLRPRRPIRPSLNLNGSGFKNSTNGSSKVQEKRVIQSSQVNHRTNNNSNNNRSENQKKEKGKIEFSLTLTREEIEEDLYALTGSKPSRRPKKRSKSVQKLIDNLYPGAWLQSITADSYKVSEHPGKG